jgi:ATP-dependent Clp protease ATP-binding subunit ClpC
MLDRFTDRARRALTLANQEAQRLGHDHVGSEHLLLGLIKETTGIAAAVLAEFKIDLGTVRQRVEQLGHGPSKNHPIKLQPTARYARVLEHAIDEAAALSKNYVGTEHLLLGLLRETDTTAARVLASLNLKLDDVRAAMLKLLGAPPKEKEPLLDRALRDLKLQLADEEIPLDVMRKIAEGMINAGWRPQQ